MNHLEKPRGKESFLRTGVRMGSSLFYGLRIAVRAISKRPGSMIDGISPWLLPIFERFGAFLELKIDMRAVLVSAGLAVFATVAAGLLPAFIAARPNLTPLLKKETTILGGSLRFRYRDILVAVLRYE